MLTAFILNVILVFGVALQTEQGVREVWIDSAQPVTGDGTQARPFKTLLEAMALGPVRVHVAVGTYRGPFDVRHDLELLAVSGTPIFFVEGSAPSVFRVSNHRLTLRSVSINGGLIGIDSTQAAVILNRVFVGGQREVAIQLQGGRIEAENSTLEAAVSETRGLSLEENALAKLTQFTVRGPFRYGLDVKSGSRVEAEKTVFEQAVTAVHQVGGKVQASGLTARGGRGPAMFVSKGELDLENALVNGHEYGLQTGEGAVLKIRGFTSQSAERAGLGLVGATGTLADVLILDSGAFGGIQIVNSRLAVEHFVVRSPQSYGINARTSQLELRDGLITDVKDGAGDSGDGLHFRRSQVDMRSVTVRSCAGTGLFAAESSVVTVDDFLMEHCRYAGIAADSMAKVDARSVIIRNCVGPAIAVPGAAEVRVESIDSTHNGEGVVWAECQNSARVLLARVRSDVEVQRSRCVHPWQPSAKR